MTPEEFKLLCKRTNKSNKDLASLLNISESAIDQYFSGTRSVPENVQRQIFFLVSRVPTEDHLFRPCWLVKNCPKDQKLRCPAWDFQAGTVCWFINGTICENNQHKSWREKWKTCKTCPVIQSITHNIRHHPLETEELEYQADVSNQFEHIVGRHPKMRQVYQMIKDVAVNKTTVMIQGESGTGKELVARAIHNLSPRRDHPFIVINCSAFPESLLESELFGHEKGAFTGAEKTRAGRFEQAHGGTVFLDEIGDISPQAQIKLLRVLQTQKLKRLGGDKILAVDIRIITASNKNLKNQVAAGSFRGDLFYRLNVIPINLPALRHKAGDIPLIANHFLQRYSAEFGKHLHGFTTEAMRHLLWYNWPGNVRELQHTIEYAVALAKGAEIEITDLPSSIFVDESSRSEQTDDSLKSVEKNHIIHVLESNNWNKKETAKILGISRSSLYEKMKRYELNELRN